MGVALVKLVWTVTLATTLALSYASSATAAATPQRVARTIVKAPDPANATRAVAKALAAGGVTTVRSARRAGGAGLRLRSSPLMNAKLALPASSSETTGSVSLADLASFLRRAGIPKLNARSLVVWLQKTVRIARRHPRHKLSFTPLFLAEMARLQRPSLSLTRANYEAADLRLSALEVRLITAFVQRTTLAPGTGSRRRRQTATTAQANTPCSDLSQIFEKLVPELGPLPTEVVEILIGKIGSKWSEANWDYFWKQRYRRRLPKKTKAKFEKAWGALEALVKLNDLVDLYAAAAVQVKHSPPDQQHRALTGEPNPESEQWLFTATVGLPPDRWREYLRQVGGATELAFAEALSDCANSLGVPVPSTASQLLKEIPNWEVRWGLSQDPPTQPDSLLVVMAPYGSGPNMNPFPNPPIGLGPRYSLKLVTNGHGGTSELRVDPAPEDKNVHSDPDSQYHQDPVTVTAEVMTVNTPPYGALIKALMRDLPGGILDLAVDFVLTAFPPSASDTVTVS